MLGRLLLSNKQGHAATASALGGEVSGPRRAAGRLRRLPQSQWVVGDAAQQMGVLGAGCRALCRRGPAGWIGSCFGFRRSARQAHWASARPETVHTFRAFKLQDGQPCPRPAFCERSQDHQRASELVRPPFDAQALPRGRTPTAIMLQQRALRASGARTGGARGAAPLRAALPLRGSRRPAVRVQAIISKEDDEIKEQSRKFRRSVRGEREGGHGGPRRAARGARIICTQRGRAQHAAPRSAARARDPTP